MLRTVLPSCRLAVLSCLSLYAVAQAQPRSPAGTAAKAVAKASDEAQLYRNAAFGFRYEIPYGWVDRTRETGEQGPAQPASPDNSADKAQTKEKQKPQNSGQVLPGQVLLAVFERPPEVPGETVNSAVVIAAENAASYPGLKSAEDYLGPLNELAAGKGLRSDGDPDVEEIDGRELIRADFTKALTDKLTMRQTTLVLLSKSQILSFTFIAGSEDEMDGLVNRLHFGAAKAPGR
jgi:hypothetical protein